MLAKKHFFLAQFIFLVFVVGCSVAGSGGTATPSSAGLTSSAVVTTIPSVTALNPTAADLSTITAPVIIQPSTTPTGTTSPTSTVTATPTETEVAFEVGEELTINYLRDLEIHGSEITFERELADRSNYYQHLVSYISEGHKIYGLLTIPFVQPPEGGFKAIVFNHGYIPPTAYQTTERYTAYVDYMARSGFVVFKIDYRGHGRSQGEPTGSYFSPGYTIELDHCPQELTDAGLYRPPRDRHVGSQHGRQPGLTGHADRTGYQSRSDMGRGGLQL